MGISRESESESNDSSASPAEILAPGPVLALGVFAIGVGLHLLMPLSILPMPWNYFVGAILGVVGLGILLSGLLTMRRIDKSPKHSDEPTELLTEGPFKYSRNPLYLGLIVIYLGLTALLNSFWPLILLVALVWYFNQMAKREEEYLKATFGQEFPEYTENVRRWL